MEDYVGKFKLHWVALVSGIIGIALLLTILFSPFLFGKWASQLSSYFLILGLPLLIISVFASILACVLTIYEIAVAKNDTNFKLLWICIVLAMFFLPFTVIGVIIYRYLGRSSLIR